MTLMSMETKQPLVYDIWKGSEYNLEGKSFESGFYVTPTFIAFRAGNQIQILDFLQKDQFVWNRAKMSSNCFKALEF